MSLTADLCRILLISCALFGTVQAVEMKDGRVVLNLGFLYSGSGGFVSSGAFQDDVHVCVNNAATVSLQIEGRFLQHKTCLYRYHCTFGQDGGLVVLETNLHVNPL